MQGFMQYNAEYGCGWCLQAGDYYARSMRYRHLTPPAELRTHEEIFQFAVDEVKKGIVIHKTVVVTGKLSEHIYDVSNIDNSLLKADTSDIMMICVFISSTHLGNRKFIAALPNLCDY
ncbi:hypothetical protein TKK_0013759 [Trichogramma kaykai]